MLKIKLGGGKTQEVEEKTFWHTSSHVMALAVKRLFPEVKVAIGPAIDDGFYYDFDLEHKFTDEDLEKIEEEMKKIVKEGYDVEKSEMNIDEAISFFDEKGEIYKVELLKELKEKGEKNVGIYKVGEFVDLCKGPHIENISGIKAIKLLSTSGAYWRGSEDNKMLQRIYGVTFPKKSMLDEHLEMLEEAKERDHRRINKEQDYFMTHELVGAGLPLYLPNGAVIRRELSRYIEDKEIKRGYLHVYTPSLARTDLYKISGHWDHYRDDMFPKMELDNEELVLRPMNCPHHMLVYQHALHSYRDLPLKIGELAHDFRYERSGAVLGLERVRQMCQNDSHIFAMHSQISQVFKDVIELLQDVYKDFGITDYSMRLSLRDKNDKVKYFQNDEMWDSAENQLRDTLKELGIDYYEAEGEAAFYGPKLDVQIATAIGHDITLSTIQLDFLLPEKFELEYVGEDGQKHRPVVIHRAILGTIDRFMSYIIEEYKGNMPVWLAPTQVTILPISEDQISYANELKEEMQKHDIRVVVDERAEKIGYKIREARLSKIPFMLVVGQKEVEEGTVSVRTRDEGEQGSCKKEEIIKEILKEIQEKKLPKIVEENHEKMKKLKGND